MVFIKWFGQACFEIQNSETVVTDPHDGEQIGLMKPDTMGDIVTISHDHYDHSAGLDLVKKPDSEVIQGETDKEVKGIHIRSVDSYHDKTKGSKRGENNIYVIGINGIKICHLGDLGHLLSKNKIDEIGDIDILMIPVGGNYTINAEKALETMNELDPSLVIPMHYKLPGLKVDISPDDEFMQRAIEEGYKINKENIAEIDELPEETEIVRLECQALKR